MTKVSIVVPFYNTEKYIGKCLDSLVNQTLSDIEIICVNDGSTDKSLEIVQNFANKDARIKIIEQENLKQGAARNNGTKFATGEYIGFVDSDDWIDLDYYEKLYFAAKKYDSDIALAVNVRIGNGKTKKRLNIEKEEFKTILQEKFDICSIAKNPCPTNKIYKLTMLKNNDVVWSEGCYCEDKLFSIQAVYYANGVVSVPGVNYYYFRNPDSTVNSKKTQKHIDDKLNAQRAVLNFAKEKNMPVANWYFKAEKRRISFLNLPLFIIKESTKSEKGYLFGVIRLYERALG